MDGREISHEEIELRSPFPVIPPVKDSKWTTPPVTPDGQSQPLKPPQLHPDIGEPHPCPYFVGPDLNFVKVGKRKKKPPPPVVIPPPPPPIPIPSPPSPDPDATDEENEVIEACLHECLHGVVWEYIAEHSTNDMTREMFSALISSNPKKFIMDRATLSVLWRKISKDRSDPNWTEPCEPIDRLKLDVLTAQAYKLSKARYTVTNEGIADFHRRVVTQTTSNHLVDLYSPEMEEKLKRHDAKDFKQQPPRVSSWIAA